MFSYTSIGIFTGVGTNGAWDKIDYSAIISNNRLAQDVVCDRLFLRVYLSTGI